MIGELETIQAWEGLIEAAADEGVHVKLVTVLDDPWIEMSTGGITRSFESISGALGFLTGLSVARKL